MNVALARVLYAHALVAAPDSHSAGWLAPVGRSAIHGWGWPGCSCRCAA
jgi:hypothetical protein